MATREKKSVQVIKEIIETTLLKLGVEGSVDTFESADETKFVVRTREGGVLIGENGRNLFALTHIVRRISDGALSEQEKIPFSLDVNDYQAKRIEDLKAIARIGAQRVRHFKKPILMKPMSAYERRIVHTALVEYPDIITESTGEDPNRQVIIKPYS